MSTSHEEKREDCQVTVNPPPYLVVMKVLGWIALAGMSWVLKGKFSALVTSASDINVVLGLAGLLILLGFWVPVVVSWILNVVKLLNSQGK